MSHDTFNVFCKVSWGPGSGPVLSSELSPHDSEIAESQQDSLGVRGLGLTRISGDYDDYFIWTGV